MFMTSEQLGHTTMWDWFITAIPIARAIFARIIKPPDGPVLPVLLLVVEILFYKRGRKIEMRAAYVLL